MIDISEIGIGSIVRINRPYKHSKSNCLIKVDDELYELMKVDPHIADPVTFTKNLIENTLKLKPDSLNKGYRLFAQYVLILNNDNTVELQEYAEFILRLKQNIQYLHQLQNEFYSETNRELDIEFDTILRMVYNQDDINIVEVLHCDDNLFRLNCNGEENYSYSLDSVIDESLLTEEQKTHVKNDLELNPRFL